MTQEMNGKVAIVTGGASGIGRAAALAFMKRGARVVVADLAVNNGEETVRMIAEGGSEGIFVKTDVSRISDVKAMVNTATKKYGRLDYAFNNAGIEYIGGDLVECSEEKWMKIIDINLNGIWRCMKYEIPEILKQGKGAIVNTSSIGGLEGVPNSSPYIASKHGVIGITRAASAEYTKAGIRVNAVCPGLIDTPMVKRLSGSTPRESVESAQKPIERLGYPEEIAEAVVWLCSDAASFVCGHVMVVDGGATALGSAPPSEN